MNTDSTSPAASEPPPLPSSPEEANAKVAERGGWPALPKLLRWLGAITLLSSALTFLVGNWMQTDQVARYAYFLGFTGLLSACGYFCISRWKDDKGARTFFALGAALLPANFAQLGAMLYAKLDGEKSFDGYREAFQFQAMETGTLLGVFAVALGLLIPLTYVGFAAMARKQAKLLTAVYLAANATLLITVRDANWVALIGFAMLGGLLWADRHYFAPQSRMRTWDGVAMRSLLFAPFGLLLGRNLVLHGADSNAIYSLLCTTLAAVLFVGLPRCIKQEKHRWIPRVFALPPAFIAWSFLVTNFTKIDDNWAVQLLLPWTIIAGLMSVRLGPMAREVRNLSALSAIFGVLLNLALIDSATASLLAVGTSLAVILVGYGARERWVFRFGLVGMGLGLVYHLRYAMELFQSDWLWVSLAGTGVAVLLASSYLERYGKQGLAAVRTLHHKVSGWK